MSHTTRDDDHYLQALVHNSDFSGDVGIVFRLEKDGDDLYEVQVEGHLLIQGRLDQTSQIALCYGRELYQPGVPYTYESYNPPKRCIVPVRVLLRACVVAATTVMRDRAVRLMEDL